MPARAVVADGNGLVGDLVTIACKRENIDVVAQVSTLYELRAAAADRRPDIAILSTPLSGSPVDGVVGELVEQGIRVMVVGDDRDQEGSIRVLEQGASSYVTYEMGIDAMAAAVVRVAQGGIALSEKMAVLVLEQWRQLRSERRISASLTTREQEVLVAMAEGLPTKAIACRLGVALKTVESHKIRVFDKLGARTQAHAVSIAIAGGLLPSVDESANAS